MNFLTSSYDTFFLLRGSSYVGFNFDVVVLIVVLLLVSLGDRAFMIGQSVLKAASSKVVTHEKTCSNNQHVFIQFVFDTFGFLALEFVDLLHRVQMVMHLNFMSLGP